MAPKPQPNETRAKFISRALKDEELAKQYPDLPGRMKVCSAIYSETRKAERTEVAKGAVPFKSTPWNERKDWDFNVAVKGLSAWAKSGDKLDLSKSADRNKYAQGFAFVWKDGETLDDYLLPHHEVVSGKLTLNKPALAACIAALNGARGGIRLNDSQRRAAFNHLAKHYREDLDADMPEFKKRMESTHRFFKVEEHPDYTFVLGPVLVPESIDKQGDIIAADEIEKTAHDYMEDSQRPGLMHQLMLGSRDVQVVESYIMRDETKVDDRVIKAGTWMVAMRIYNDDLRKMVRTSKLRGFSIGGHGVAEEEPAT